MTPGRWERPHPSRHTLPHPPALAPAMGHLELVRQITLFLEHREEAVRHQAGSRRVEAGLKDVAAKYAMRVCSIVYCLALWCDGILANWMISACELDRMCIMICSANNGPGSALLSIAVVPVL